MSQPFHRVLDSAHLHDQRGTHLTELGFRNSSSEWVDEGYGCVLLVLVIKPWPVFIPTRWFTSSGLCTYRGLGRGVSRLPSRSAH